MDKKIFDLQMFAAGNNEDLPVRSYQKEFKQLLQVVFAKQSYFADFFGGSIEALGAWRENRKIRCRTSQHLYIVMQYVYNWEEPNTRTLSMG